ncbi:cation diffusion facilitator family transporter [Butyrivibrio sp. DSM 10294]|uniref:cation diffusion facilitator family transporter n=1 Tax=Butyrivibrio sp. DSM 10294 TaxID=2972457 RepID=UPI00234E50C5|nr:cation diffusion facilitator family transporter [Butyrivibrio sp. DSM 10294]MDC7294668.1 cation diffusion facilitator family transporter [Butyrivibrio sp. DSM 10294]
MAEQNSAKERGKIIIRTSIIGIVVNILLAGFKMVVGLISGSIAIVLDAVNNLSDALSSVITIVGTALAGKAPDRKHPYGYGRIEYLSAMIISVIVLYAGITSLVESIKAIFAHENPEYSVTTLVIIAVAVIAKLGLGTFFIGTGKKIRSESLVASGTDARFDAIISLSTLVAAIIFVFTGVSLEAYLGAIISLFLIKTALEMLRGTLSQILGERIDSSVSKAVKKTILSVDGVIGAYDLIFSDYGPDRVMASVHIEIPDTFTADKIDVITRRIQEDVFAEHNVMLVSIGIYSVNTKDEKIAKVRNDVSKILSAHDEILQMHGFFVDFERKNIRFDMVVDFAPDRKDVFEAAISEVQEKYPDYNIVANMDSDYSD